MFLCNAFDFIFAVNGFSRDVGFFTDKFKDAVCRIKNKILMIKVIRIFCIVVNDLYFISYKRDKNSVSIFSAELLYLYGFSKKDKI